MIVIKLFRFFFAKCQLLIYIFFLYPNILEAQTKDMNKRKQFDFFEVGNIESFIKTYKKRIQPFKNTIDNNPLPLPFQISGILSDSSTDFSICDIPIKSIYVYESINSKIIYILIENKEEIIEIVKNKYSQSPFSVMSSSQQETPEFIDGYYFEKNKNEIWLMTGKSIFTGINDRSNILIAILNGNFELIKNTTSL